MNKKAILALLVAGIMIVSVPMVAMAADETSQISDSSGKITKTVDGNLTISTNVSAIDLSQGSTVEIKGDVESTSTSNPNNTVLTKNNADNSVTVTGSVNTSGNTMVIYNEGGTVNVAGDVTGNVPADSKSETAVVYGDGKSNTISPIKSETIIGGDVKNNSNGISINANNGATVSAGSATNKGVNSATPTLYVDNATVTVTGAVTDNGVSYAIYAKNGATVLAGSATNGIADRNGNITVHAEGSNTTVVITDSVTNKGLDKAIGVSSGATVVVEGTAEANNAPIYIDDAQSKVIVYEIKNNGTGNLVQGSLSNPNDCVYYIIKGTDCAEFTKVDGTTTQTVLKGTTNEKSYDTAKYNEVITVSVASGYELKAGTIAVTQNADGTYSVTVPMGGGVTLEAIKKAIEEAKSSGGGSSSSWSSVPTTYGSASAPITGGRWSKNADGSFTYYNNGEQPLNNRVWIKYNGTDGKEYTGCFYFDKQGKMQTGWKQIDGEWYYFDETEGNTKGMMQVNTTTPDGYKVDANGKWVK